ncbi:MAG: nicotinate phosphoribosyltransferase, partial [Candidatus Omnitrophica bacterium]|nr:nicotinate phosphoribosyltransferase [Candidatus Omnitrophota bacterium]
MNKPLSLDLYELTMAQSYFIHKRSRRATFDLFIRTLPRNRSYLVACGLEDVVRYLEGLCFSAQDCRYLAGLKLFSPAFLRFLRRFRFRGDLWAMPEGTPFFASEPVIRVTASLIEAQIIESALLNTVHLQTLIASKAARVVHAAGGKKVFDFSLRRTHGSEAGLKAARAAYIAGCAGTSNCLAGQQYGIPVVGTMAHSYVQSFPGELDSFLAYAATYPDKSILLVDTYNTRRGVAHAVTVGRYLRERGHVLKGIRLDSGNLARLSQMARRQLDKAGLRDTLIFASGNLDEHAVASLRSRRAFIDSFGVGTNLGTSRDEPSLDIIYKISQVTDERGRFLPTMKLSRGKASYPGRKQVFRRFNARAEAAGDILALENERIAGVPLLRCVLAGGRRRGKLPSLKAIRAYAQRSVASLPEELKRLSRRYRYPVTGSPKLEALRRKCTRT